MILPVKNLFNNEEKSSNVIKFLTGMDKFTPHKTNIFKCFNVNEENLKLVIVNSQPHFDPETSSGLLFGHNNADKQSALFRNFTNSYAIHAVNDIAYDENSFDFTFQGFLDKNILMVNICLATYPFTIIRDNDINNKESHTYYWKNCLMDELFYYLNYFDAPLDFLFIGEPNNENINYYQKEITNFYHNIVRVPSFLKNTQNIQILQKHCEK